jgi:protein-disulfide isomerase
MAKSQDKPRADKLKGRQAAAASAKKSSMTPMLIGVGVIVLAVVLYAGNNYLVGKRTTTEQIDLAGVEGAQLLELAKGIPVGDTAAPIKIWEFADYSCPHCKEFHEIVETRLDLAYLQGGKVQMVFFDYPMPVGPHSFLAARAARCAADQGKFKEYSDALFDNQALWAPASGVPVGAFTDYAKTLGLDDGAFKSCLQSDKHADVVSANRALGDQVGVNGTPSIYIQQTSSRLFRPVRNATYDSIAVVLDSLLSQQTASTDSTTKPPAR